MATPVWCCGGECGIKGANVGEHWASSSGTTSFDTTTKRSGARSIRVNPTAGVAFVASNVGYFTGGTMAVLRLYVYIASHPTSDTLIAGVKPGSTYLGLVYQSSDSKYYAGRDNGGTLTVGSSGATLNTGQWYRVDIKANVVGNPWTVDVQIDGSALGQAAPAVAATTFPSVSADVRLGSNGTSETCDLYFDDLVLSLTSGDYPIGAGYVNHFVPTADGIHNVAGAADFVRGAAGADILNTTADSYLLIDEVPLDDTTPDTNDYINAIAPANSTDYVEHVFGPASGIAVPTTAPRAVEVIVAYHQAGTGSGSSQFKLNDGGVNTIVALNAAGVTTTRYSRAHYATGTAGGAWKALVSVPTSRNASSNLQAASASAAYGQSFIPTSGDNVNGIILWLERVASPADSITLELVTNAINDATVIRSATIAGSALLTTSGGRLVTFTFASPVALTQGQTYYWRVFRTGSLDNTNYYKLYGASTSVYADGTSYAFSGSWSAGSTDYEFRLLAVSGNFNDLRHRFGFSADANPDQYFDCAMIEADFAEVVAAATVAPRPFMVGQAVNRAATF